MFWNFRALGALRGERVDVLWERCVNEPSGEWVGYTPHYHKIKAHMPDLKSSGIRKTKVDKVSTDNGCLLGAKNETLVQDLLNF